MEKSFTISLSQLTKASIMGVSVVYVIDNMIQGTMRFIDPKN